MVDPMIFILKKGSCVKSHMIGFGLLMFGVFMAPSLAWSAAASNSEAEMMSTDLLQAKVEGPSEVAAIKISCAMKYESDLKGLFSAAIAPGEMVLLSLTVSDDNGIEVGAGKCGCGSDQTAYINYYDSMDSLQRICVTSSGSPVSPVADAGKSVDELWCDECLEPELLSQVNGTCGCPDGWTARIMNGVVYCSGEEGKVVSRQDDMELTSSLKYLSVLDSSAYESDGSLKLTKYQAMSSGSAVLYDGQNVLVMTTKVKMDLDTSKCESVLAAVNAIGGDVIAAGADASSVIKSDNKCYYRSPAGEDFAVDDQFQRACKNTASIDEEQSKLVPVKLSIGSLSIIGK